MTEYEVADVTELGESDRIVVDIEGKDIGVFRIDGEYYAYTNWCLHQAGPVCEGRVNGTRDATFDPETLEMSLEWVKDGEILNCPWHGWEYDILTGECLSRHGRQLVSYPVREENGTIIITV